METPHISEKSKPTVPPKPRTLTPSAPSVFATDTSRCTLSSSSETCRSKCGSDPPASVNLKTRDSPKISNSPIKPPILPKPAHLRNFRSPVPCNQTSPIIPKNLSNLKSTSISECIIKDSETVISADGSESLRSSSSEKCPQNVVEIIGECTSIESSLETFSRKFTTEELPIISAEVNSNQLKVNQINSIVSFKEITTNSNPPHDQVSILGEKKSIIVLPHVEETSTESTFESHETTVNSHKEVTNVQTKINFFRDIENNIQDCDTIPSNFEISNISNLESNKFDSQEQNGRTSINDINLSAELSNASDDSTSFHLAQNEVPEIDAQVNNESNLNLLVIPAKQDMGAIFSKFKEDLNLASSCRIDGTSGSDLDISKCSKGNQSDVESVGSDTSGSYSVRRRLSLWFGSFGKGAKDRKNKRRSFTFYSDDSNAEEGDSSASRINDSVANHFHDSSIKVSSSLATEENGDYYASTQDKTSLDAGGNRSSMSDESLENVAWHASNVTGEKPAESEADNSKEKKKRKAFLVAKELTMSEKVFVNALKLICDNFTGFIKNYALDSSNPVLPQRDLDKLVGTLPSLLLFNQVLLQDFENRINSWATHPKIADVIVKKGPFLKLYISYYKNFQSQCEFLDDCCQKYSRFDKALKDFESSDICKKLTLKHYMLKPVQRIPQYGLLLEDYLSNLDSDSEDYLDTKQALHVVRDVANHANRSMKQGDHLSKLLQIQAQLGNYEIVRPGREFVKEGELYKLSRKNSQLRFLILLSDSLILTSYYGSMTGLKVNYEFPLSGMKVYIPQTEDHHNEFSIITTTRSFSLRARTPVERQEWVTALEGAIDDNIRRVLSFMQMEAEPTSLTQNGCEFKIGKEAPVWIQDGRVTMCQLCTAQFTMTFRRHHCRACGKVVCGNCSDYKAPLQYMKFQAERVCEDCFNVLIKEFEDSPDQMYETIQRVLNLASPEAVNSAMEDIFQSFKKAALGGYNKSKKIQEIPQRLREVTANDSGSQTSGWLLYQKEKRSWKRFWFVLKDQALYFYKASEDVVALGSVAVLGYQVENVKEDLVEVSDPKRVFQLVHQGRKPITFCADDRDAAQRWMKELKEATILR